jgi:hypothetical protein
MYGLTRGPITLLAAGAAGFLVWLATRFDDHTTGGYWAVYGIIAGAGLVMALSQLLGGWTKWGWPRMSASVFLFAFLPALVAVGWIAVAGQPHANPVQSHVLNWSGDIGIRGLVRDLIEYIGVLAFGLGLVFGFCFDTTGASTAAPPAPALTNGRRDEVEIPVTDRGTSVPAAPASTPTTEREETPVGAGWRR